VVLGRRGAQRGGVLRRCLHCSSPLVVVCIEKAGAGLAVAGILGVRAGLRRILVYCKRHKVSGEGEAWPLEKVAEECKELVVRLISHEERDRPGESQANDSATPTPLLSLAVHRPQLNRHRLACLL